MNLGISVVAANISKGIVDRFLKSLKEDAKPKISYEVKIITEKDNIYTNYKGHKYYNRNKAHNIGIRHFLDKAEVILCSDVDFLIGPETLDKTCSIGRQQPFFGIARFLNPGVNINIRSWKEWMKIKTHDAGYGGWIAMTPHNWKKIGGWNETMFSWGFDRHIFQRVINAELNPIRHAELPIVHVNHGRRNKDIREIDKSILENLGFENYL